MMDNRHGDKACCEKWICECLGDRIEKKVCFQGKATGNRYALYSRSLIQKLLFALGNAVHNNAWSIILTISMFFALCCYGLQYVHIETDIVKLWVARKFSTGFDRVLNLCSRGRPTRRRTQFSAEYQRIDEECIYGFWTGDTKGKRARRRLPGSYSNTRIRRTKCVRRRSSSETRGDHEAHCQF